MPVTHAKVSAKADGADATVVRPSDWNAGHVIDPWTDFTPTWISDGTQPSLGNGTLVGRYRQIDSKLYLIRIEFSRGSTSTNGTGAYGFSGLPFTAAGVVAQVASCFLLDAGTRNFVATAYMSQGLTFINQILVADSSGAGNWTDSNPMVLATGDQCLIQGFFEAT